MLARTQTIPLDSPAVFYAVEMLSGCRDAVERLKTAHSREFTYYLDQKGPVAPDWLRAASLEATGRMRVATARIHGELVGYFVMVTDRSMHYEVTLCLDDTFYLAPEYRAGWGLYAFLKFATDEMAKMGGPGSCLVVANKVDQDLAPIWDRLGFVPEEIRRTKMVER